MGLSQNGEGSRFKLERSLCGEKRDRRFRRLLPLCKLHALLYMLSCLCQQFKRIFMTPWDNLFPPGCTRKKMSWALLLSFLVHHVFLFILGGCPSLYFPFFSNAMFVSLTNKNHFLAIWLNGNSCLLNRKCLLTPKILSVLCCSILEVQREQYSAAGGADV